VSKIALLLADSMALAVFHSSVDFALAYLTALAKFLIHGKTFDTLATVLTCMMLFA
jgi:hypothetical protein